MRYSVSYEYDINGINYVIYEYRNKNNVIKKGKIGFVNLSKYDCRNMKEYLLGFVL